jgi:ELWxxDGT repeat protein
MKLKNTILLGLVILGAASNAQAQVTLVQDLEGGTNGSFPNQFIEFKGELYMSAYRTAEGRELFKTNGTTISLVSDIRIGGDFSSPQEFTVLGDTLYFSAYENGTIARELYKTDGVTVTLADDINTIANYGSLISEMTVFNNALYFVAATDFADRELFFYDPSVGSSQRVFDINPGTTGSNPEQITEFNGELYFVADDGTNGQELWKTTSSGTSAALVQDIFTGSDSSYISELTVFKNELYFVAEDGTNGRELWKTNGATTTMVMDINSGGSSFPRRLTVLGDTLYFRAEVGGTIDNELYKTDGTTVTLADDINTIANYGSFIGEITVLNNRLYFSAATDNNDRELFFYDPSVGSSQRVKDVNPGLTGSSPRLFTIIKDVLYFVATDDGTMGEELWKTSGDTAVLVDDINTGAAGSQAFETIVFNNSLYLQAVTATTGAELFKHTHILTGINKAELRNENSFNVYPNPAKDQITISFNGNIKGAYTVSIKNSLGQIVKEFRSTNRLVNVDINQLDGGVYFVQVADSESISTTKIIKK